MRRKKKNQNSLKIENNNICLHVEEISTEHKELVGVANAVGAAFEMAQDSLDEKDKSDQ